MLTPLRNSVTSDDSSATRMARMARECSLSEMAAISLAPYVTAPSARKLGCVLEDFKLTRLQARAAFLVLRRHRFASPTGALVERHGEREQGHGDDKGQPAGRQRT